MNKRIVNPYNKMALYSNKYNAVSGRGATFYCLNNTSCYRRFSLVTHGTNYKGFRIILSRRISEI